MTPLTQTAAHVVDCQQAVLDTAARLERAHATDAPAYVIRALTELLEDCQAVRVAAELADPVSWRTALRPYAE